MGAVEEKGLAYRIMDVSESILYAISKEDFHIVYANPKAKEIFGEEFDIFTCYQYIADKDSPCTDCPFVALHEGDQCIEKRYIECVHRDLMLKADDMIWDDGSEVILITIVDSDQLLQAKLRGELAQHERYEEVLRSSGELYAEVVKQLKTIVFEYNVEKGTSYTSALFQEKFGIREIEDVDFTKKAETKSLIYPEDLPVYNMLFMGRDDDFREVTCRLKEINGNVVWYRVSIQFVRDDEGRLLRMIGTLKDVDDFTKSHEILKYRSEYDTLTNIPNINRFYIDAGYLLNEQGDNQYAIISFDIDKFKMINDLFGMETGDDVLKHVAKVLKERLSDRYYYCRMHSDRFLVCAPYQKKGDLIKLIEKIRRGIYRNEFSFDINTSFGIYPVVDSKIPINLMCDRATLAAKTIKGSAMNFCAFYDEQYRNEIIKTTEIERDMNQAISDKQFVMYLQPKYSLLNGKICGAEVLARWKHPTKGLIQPMDFIPLFERNGFILKLDEYMWEEACKTLAGWRAEGKTPFPLSVNISRYHIKHNDLIGVWKRLIEKYDIPTSFLTLEITETFFYDSEDLYEVLAQLQEMGFRLEVDDFGAGYSSLNMIRQVPVDTIKIDKDFLDKKLATDKGKIVINHTIAMAKDLKLSVIAEGVETKEHVEFLKETSCDVAQGYFFAKPMPLEEFNRIYYAE